ncbi:MAG TPA: hypothetical protein PLW68_06580 [Casimicrobiaceae bacterium]|nr:hypothetical protein [Casimicrobiaceae bacterium]
MLSLALSCPGAHAADAGIFSIVEGEARVLRDTTWYKLVPGARFQEGDILAARGIGQVQVELATGGAFNLGSPATMFVVAIPAIGGKAAGPMDVALEEGWLKFAATAPSGGIRVQFESASLLANDGIAVIRVQPGTAEVFVETGSAKLAEVAPRGGPSPATMELKSGEFAALSAQGSPRVDRRAPATFVAAIPRHLIDPLPAVSAKYKDAKIRLPAEQEVSFAEAEPWLAGPYRKIFIRRFQPRLKDPTFRADVEARISQFPEWDRVLHPERYLPRAPAKAQ